MAESKATAHWEGDLMSGKGKTSTASGILKDAVLGWKARAEGSSTNTTPEELLASAHASCFSMALAHALATSGHKPTRLETSCVVTFGPKPSGFEIKGSALTVKGTVPGCDEATFKKIAEDAKNGCPVSAALKIPMTLQASLG